MSKTFTDLPPHYQVIVKLEFWRGDSWDNEVYKILIDNAQAYAKTYQ